MNKLNVAIVGCGSISQVHIEVINLLQMTHLVLVCDSQEEKAKQLALKENVDYVTNFDDVLKDKTIHIIHILTPHYLHSKMAKEALLAGKHVVLEKPVGINYTEMKELLDIANKVHLTIGVTLQNRSNTTVIKMKELVNSGKLGALISSKGYVAWNREKKYYSHSSWRGQLAKEGGGLLINQAIHTLDLMEYIGGKIKSIKGNIMNFNHPEIEVEDTCAALFNYENGGVGNFYGTNNHGINSDVELEFVFENGTLHLLNQQLHFITPISKEIISTDLSPAGEKAYWGLGHKACIQDIYEAIYDNRLPQVSIVDGIAATELVLKIYESSQKNISILR